jgi:hypothetical protein
MAEPFYRLGEWIVPPVVAMQGTVPRRLGGSAPSQDDSRAIRLAELQERAQRYGSDGVTRPGQSQSGLH